MYRSALTCSTCRNRTMSVLRKTFMAKKFCVAGDAVLSLTKRTRPNVPVPSEYMFQL